MEKQRTVLYLTAETAHALGEYLRLHRARFRSRSDAAEHLLRRALAGALAEGVEDLLAPAIVRGKDAYRATRVAAENAWVLDFPDPALTRGYNPLA
jgi:hypothetical protein